MPLRWPLATSLVRLAFPFDSQKCVYFNLFQWPAYLAAFALGIAASRWDWLRRYPIGCARSAERSR